MKSKFWKAVFAILIFTFALAVMGPYECAGLSAAVMVALLIGVSMGPLCSVITVALYLVLGIWLPVYGGGGSGLGVLFGREGGFLLVLLPCVLVIAALIKGMQKHPLLAAILGLAISFVLYFAVGILWYVVCENASLVEVLGKGWGGSCLLFFLQCVLAFFVSGPLRRTVR
jgi:biotin transport system substrate-specific component